MAGPESGKYGPQRHLFLEKVFHKLSARSLGHIFFEKMRTKYGIAVEVQVQSYT